MNHTIDYGIYLYGSGALVTGNTVNSAYVGIYDDENTGDTVSGNTGTHDLYGLYAYESTDETYTDNTFNRGQFGFETNYPTGEVLTGNTASHNSDTGVYIYTGGSSGYTATLTGNTGNYNRYGLYSQIPTSGSGNHAAHNKVINCYNVSCGHAGPRASGATGALAHHMPRAVPAPVLPARR